MPKYFLKSFLIFAFIFASRQTIAQNSGEKIAELNIPSISGIAHPGDTLLIPVKILLKKGWHINSDKPEEDFLIPTKLNINSGSDSISYTILYPKPEELRSELSDKPMPVFTGGSVIECSVQIPKNFSRNKITLNFELDYQACSSKTCSAPETAIFTKDFEIKNQ